MLTDPMQVIDFYYPGDTPFKRLLLRHSISVRDKALELLTRSGMTLDCSLIIAGAMLHDLGIGRCHAPSILCEGSEPYIAHGIIGAGMLRDYGAQRGLDLELLARIAERHTGSGLSADDVRRQNLPLPMRDFLPETREERLICLADKFYSKSGDMKEKSLDRARHSLEKFGEETLARFDALCREFNVTA